MERDTRFQRLPLHILHGPQSRKPPPGSPHRTPIERDRERHSISSALLHMTLRVPGKIYPSRFPNGIPMEIEACF
jgi:hypothetical protein